MRRIATVLLILAAVAPAACRKEREGEVRVTVIGQAPRLVDPAQGALSTPDAVLVGNVAQGLVRFDAGGNVIGGLAERWNVSDDGMSYIFRIASTNWPDGRKVTAQQVARILSREIGPRSRNELKDTNVTVTCLMPGATDTEFFERAGMLDTKVGTDPKDDPADVAKVGFDAMMKGEGDVVAGLKNKIQTSIANVTPAAVLAEQHRKMAEPGTGKKK